MTDIAEDRLVKIIDDSVDAAMAVVKQSLPEFPDFALEDLKADIEMYLSDTIESHIAGLTEEERV